MFAEPFILRLADAASAWMLTYLVHSTLLVLGVWAVTSLRTLRDTTRDVLWKLALVGGLVSASVQTVVAREPLGGQLRLDARRAHGGEPLRFAVRETVDGNRTRLFVADTRGTKWTALAIVLWAAGAGGALLWLTWAHARAVRAFDDRTPLHDAPIASRLDALLARSGVRRDITLTCSANLASPVALATGEVCLPRRALVELDASEQESMLAHEVAHVVRRDPHWLIAARVIEAVFFIQPLNRLARHRMQAVAEFLCDDWAVQRTSQPVTLAKCLAAVAEWVGCAPRQRAMSAMVQRPGSPLVQRVRRILGGGHGSRGHSTRGALGMSVCALVAMAVAAPRISVADEVMGDRGRDAVFIVRADRFVLDSAVSHASAPSAGGRLVDRGTVIVRRIPLGALRGDSAAPVRRIRIRSLPGFVGAGAGASGRASPIQD
ncbi:MAG TPA: M56 family metallopeptidase [Gemmatimonadaceae bacterium]|nr:M56 family metallopeptidase [Gemmatimonadaceae bacterium]